MSLWQAQKPTRSPHLTEAQVLIEAWRRYYNAIRPHRSLGYRPPAPETIVALSFMVPVPESLDSARGTFTKLIAANRGHAQMGRELKASFIEAGLSDVRASASFDVFSSPQDFAFLHKFVSGWFFSPDVVGAATKYDLATQEQFDE